MVPFAEAQDKQSSAIELIERKSTSAGLIAIYCIGGYVFVTKPGKDSGFTQLMRQSPEHSGNSHPTPMQCSEYRSRMKR